MKARTGEKVGWLLGFSGGFLWLLILSIIWIFQGFMFRGIIGLSLFIVSIFIVILTSPWKSPNTKYWKLMLPVYVMLFICIVYGFWYYSINITSKFQYFQLLSIFPAFLPFYTIGKKTWTDLERKNLKTEN